MSGTSLDEQGLGTPEQGIRPQRLALLGFAADKDHLALARMTAMHVAGLAGLPIGKVTDLRLAVDEACSLFLSGPGGPEPGAMLTLRFDRLADGLTDQLRIAVSGPAPARRPDGDDLGWLMLCALVGRPTWEVRDGIGTLTMFEPLPPVVGAGR